MPFQLFYQGNGSILGITEKDVPKGEWKKVELPEQHAKISFIQGDHTGSFCLAISDQGTVYFGGTNRKGEAAENRELCRCIDRLISCMIHS